MTRPSPGAASPALPEQRSGVLRVIGNVLWLVLAGFWMAMAYVAAGLVQMATIIGIPLGVQSFKMAGYALWPFGRVIVDRPGAGAATSCVGNMVWFALSGVWLAAAHLLTGVILCLTVFGIPFGIASFKLARFALWPFGRVIVPADSVARDGSAVYLRI
jgi:uncharacterized membrane protein YccF (DUF307 family)